MKHTIKSIRKFTSLDYRTFDVGDNAFILDTSAHATFIIDGNATVTLTVILTDEYGTELSRGNLKPFEARLLACYVANLIDGYAAEIETALPAFREAVTKGVYGRTINDLEIELDFTRQC
jgi:hypothetical protein